EQIPSAQAGEGVIAVAADEDVVAGAAPQRIVSTLAVELSGQRDARAQKYRVIASLPERLDAPSGRKRAKERFTNESLDLASSGRCEGYLIIAGRAADDQRGFRGIGWVGL